jgi:hypothetical protein
VAVEGSCAEDVGAFAAFAVGVPVAEVVDVAVRLAVLGFDEDVELAEEVAAVRCFVASEDFDDAPGGVGEQEEPVVLTLAEVPQGCSSVFPTWVGLDSRRVLLSG